MPECSIRGGGGEREREIYIYISFWCILVFRNDIILSVFIY